MSQIPVPPLVPIEDINRRRVRFSFRYARKKGSWGWRDFSDKDKRITIRKIHELSRNRLHDFKTGPCRPRKWNKRMPKAPDDLSEDIRDMLADYFDINPKIRLFGYLLGRTFHVIWFSSNHKHSK